MTRALLGFAQTDGNFGDARQLGGVHGAGEGIVGRLRIGFDHDAIGFFLFELAQFQRQEHRADRLAVEGVLARLTQGQSDGFGRRGDGFVLPDGGHGQFDATVVEHGGDDHHDDEEHQKDVRQRRDVDIAKNLGAGSFHKNDELTKGLNKAFLF